MATIKYTFADGHTEEIEVTEEFKRAGGNNGETVNTDVSLTWDETGLIAELYRNGEYAGLYENGTVLTDSAAYKIIVTDVADNATEISFVIDKVADFTADINDQGLANSVTLTAHEALTSTLTKDGETIEYSFGEIISVPGRYLLNVTDALGNRAELSFTIVEPLARSFEYNFDDMPGFEKVMVNGEEKRLNYGTLELKTDGKYEVGVVVDGKTYLFTLMVDATPPTVLLNGVENNGKTKETVTISELSEAADLKVYKNDEEIEYRLGDKLSETGKYRVVVTDLCGNAAVYEFEILYSMNAGAIILVGLGILALIGLGVTIFLMRKKGRFGNDKTDKNKTEKAE